MKNYLNKAAGLFFVLCVVFIPFLHKEQQSGITRFIFLKAVKAIGGLLLEKPIILADFSSDTRSLLLLLIFLAIISCSAAIFLKKKQNEIIWACKTVTLYFLAYVLLKYGLDKVFCRQFYQPAPNILYTPFGNLDKDILFWSTMGTSPAYSIITGSFEVLAALLLLFRRTRTLGLLLALVALVQILIINFSFDISVKIFSLLLTAMALYLLAPQLKSFYNFLVLQKMTLMPQSFQVNLPVYVKIGLKFFMVGLILIQVLAAQFPTTTNTPLLLTGAYKVEKYEGKSGTIPLQDAPVKRIFVHPHGYLVFQTQDDAMADYFMVQGSGKGAVELLDYSGGRQKITIGKQGSSIILHFANGTVITASPLPWQKMPALQNQFHFFVDEIR